MGIGKNSDGLFGANAMNPELTSPFWKEFLTEIAVGIASLVLLAIVAILIAAIF
jgi:hypothetical protein